MTAPRGHHDTSSCSTIASEQSDRDKRKRANPNDEEATFKPYECRFCPMKFAKSQALGGHMNRHRQEREREQVMQARQLLMQQEFSSALLMSGAANASPALPKLSQAHLTRSASEGSLKDGIRMGAPPSGATSAYRGVLPPSNPYVNSSLGGPSLSWSNLSNVLETTQNSVSAFSLDGAGMVPSYQGRQAYLNNNLSYIMQQQPLNRVHSQHDMMLSVPPYDKAMQLSMYPFDSNTPTTAHRSNSMPSQQNQGEEGSILAGSTLVGNSDMSKNVHAFSQALSSQSQQQAAIGNGFQFISYPGTDGGTRSSLDFNLSSTNQLDGLPWMHAGNTTKTARTLNVLSTAANDEYHHELENSEPKMEDGSLTGTTSEQPKTMRWPDLALSSPEESKMRDLTPVVGEVSTLQFDTDYDNATSELGGRELINE